VSETKNSASQESKVSFFRQSGWMMISTFLMGVCMWAVHPLSNHMSSEDYETANTMLRLLMFMGIPAGALQMVFAKYSSSAISEDEKRQLGTAFRAVLKYGTLLWGLVFCYVGFAQDWIVATWQLTGPAALWGTCAAGVTWFWWAVMIGVIQGRQNFLWYGFAAIFNGIGRVVVAVSLVLLLGWGGSGIVFGAWFGLTVSAATVAWHARDLFQTKEARPDWSKWTIDLIPLAMFGAIMTILMTSDIGFVQARFPSGEIAPYNVASVLALAMVNFTVPIAGVMYPKIVRSVRLDEKSNALPLTVMTTAIVAACGAIALTLVAPIAIRYGFSARFEAIAPLVPWFAWGMFPLTMTNVLIAHLLATTRYRAIAVLLAIAIGYLITLSQTVPSPAPGSDLMPHFKRVVWTIGGFNFLLLLVTIAFCRLGAKNKS
jgi:O-antigen/teichoic acid export membrane protein